MNKSWAVVVWLWTLAGGIMLGFAIGSPDVDVVEVWAGLALWFLAGGILGVILFESDSIDKDDDQ